MNRRSLLGGIVTAICGLFWPQKVRSTLRMTPVAMDVDGEIRPIAEVWPGLNRRAAAVKERYSPWPDAPLAESRLDVRPIYWSSDGSNGKHYGAIFLDVCGPVDAISSIHKKLQEHSLKRGSQQHDFGGCYASGGREETLIIPSGENGIEPADDATAVMFAIVCEASPFVTMHAPIKYEGQPLPLFIPEPERPEGPCPHWRRPGTLECGWCGANSIQIRVRGERFSK